MKKWFESWHYEVTFIGKKRIRKFRLELPNSLDKHPLVIIAGKKISNRQLQRLEGIIVSAFDQIQKDNGGYKK